MDNSNVGNPPQNRSIHDTPVARLDFVENRSDQKTRAPIKIWDHEIFKIGRHSDSNDFAIDADSEYMVSRNHCELYTVVYEPGVTHVYVRDRKSFNGTYVNDMLVGIGPELSPGYLLQDGDVIEIKPYWKFTFHEVRNPTRHLLTDMQAVESKLFAHKYQLTNRCLGQGAEATVYLAVDSSTKKQLVCKVASLDNLKGRNGRDKIRRKFQEVDILRQLQHPNILTYIDAITSPHSLYTFTELASGGDLMSFMYRRDQVSELDCRIIIRQIVNGLHYLHGKGVVHRDLKPENVLFAYSPRIAYHRIMLADFGASAIPRRSRLMTFVGTAEYQAPELQTRGPQTMAVDMWSLGLIALNLVTPKHDIPEHLSYMSQDEIDQCLSEHFDILRPRPSLRAISFIRGCIRACPEQRMNTAEAQSHDWLCTPEKHLEFFRRFDKKMMADWSIDKYLKPMPLELQSFKDDLEHLSYPVSHRAQGGKGEDESRLGHGSNEASAYLPIPEPDENEMSLVCIPAKFNPPPTWDQAAAAPPQVRNIGDRASLTTNSSHLLPSSDSGARNKETEQQPKKRRKTSKIPESNILPLPDLGRHLRPAPTGARREQVLEELKKTNSVFLKPGQVSPVHNTTTSVSRGFLVLGSACGRRNKGGSRKPKF